MYEDIYESIKIFKEKSVEFIVWFCAKLQPHMFKNEDMVYVDGERITKFYFIHKGLASYVLPEFNFVEYVLIELGDSFGLVDVCDLISINGEDDWHRKIESLRR